MDESKLWKDISEIASSTGRTGDDVYSELMQEFADMVASRLEESYIGGRPRLQINEAEFRKMYIDGASINDLISHFHISRSSVRSFRIKLHLRPRRFMIKFDKREYIRLFKLGTPYGKMAKIFGMSRNTVMETRERLNLPRRNNRRQKEK